MTWLLKYKYTHAKHLQKISYSKMFVGVIGINLHNLFVGTFRSFQVHRLAQE